MSKTEKPLERSHETIRVECDRLASPKENRQTFANYLYHVL
ncbi:hypothetical protein [Nostoc sp. DSM 114160]